MRIEPVHAGLPPGFSQLRAEAAAEGYRHLDRLASDWSGNSLRFNRDGEALLAAVVQGALAGVGGLTVDPTEPGAMRLRQFYVSPRFRRSGIGRALAAELLRRAAELQRPVFVNAATGSAPFWEALGFVADRRDGHTHRFRR